MESGDPRTTEWMIRALFGHDAAGAAWIGLADSLGDDECGITQEDGEIALADESAEAPAMDFDSRVMDRASLKMRE